MNINYTKQWVTIGSAVVMVTAASGMALPAQAVQITANITADNHYGLYYGQSDGSRLSLVGRNEIDDIHVADTIAPVPSISCTGVFSWKCPEAWEFDADPGDYLYLAAWDEDLEQMWIGDIQFDDGRSLLSNTRDWEYAIASGNNPGSGSLPSLAAISTEIANASWATPKVSAPQGTMPWGTIAGISSTAEFVWHDTLSNDSDSDRNYVIFRTTAPLVEESVPEPSVTLGLGLVALAGMLVGRRVIL
ncbi:MAG: PEP-CTERM sorting domain-containing protein [Elainellaceae cyanobacterium]